MTETRVRGELGPACGKCAAAKKWSGTRWFCHPCRAEANRERKARLSDEQRECERIRANELRNKRRANWTQEQRDNANAQVAAWRTTHREQHREGSRKSYWRRASEVRATKAAEYASNPSKFVARNMKRKARLREAVCEHGPECVTAEFLADLYDKPCLYCGSTAEDADHFYPLAGGGLHCQANLVPACGPCNGSKYNHDPIEWMSGRLT